MLLVKKCKKVQLFWKIVWQFLMKLIMYLTVWPINSISMCSSKRNKSIYLHKNLCLNIRSSIINNIHVKSVWEKKLVGRSLCDARTSGKKNLNIDGSPCFATYSQSLETPTKFYRLLMVKWVQIFRNSPYEIRTLFLTHYFDFILISNFIYF